MKKLILEETKIMEAIEKLPKGSFTILDFMTAFKELFPEKWQKLVERFGLFGEKRRYTVATYLANRLYLYSHKSESCLKPFRKYNKGEREDYRRATKEEKEFFGSSWIAIYRRQLENRIQKGQIRWREEMSGKSSSTVTLRCIWTTPSRKTRWKK